MFITFRKYKKKEHSELETLKEEPQTLRIISLIYTEKNMFLKLYFTV